VILGYYWIGGSVYSGAGEVWKMNEVMVVPSWLLPVW